MAAPSRTPRFEMSTMAAADTKLARSVTVARYRELEAAGDRAALGRFIKQRFQERYFEPTVDAPSRHGFTLMAIACLTIEALESFYQGKSESRTRTRDGGSGAMFESFFRRPTGLEAFGGDRNWFYKQIRCGILHQAETVGGWRIRRDCKLLDKQQRLINGKQFVLILQAAVGDYASQLERTNDGDALWKNFRKKMDAVCSNCEAPA